ncbi:hypothetical protein EJ110_NYTH46929 [Nymphaea thermarum]|nr:hypothetical protein EJ110_NYTH46929 [Nymphaea thermarum]
MDRTFLFLGGLRDEFESICSQILNGDEIPGIEEVYARVESEEQRRQVMHLDTGHGPSAFVSRASGTGQRPARHCTDCNKLGHSVDFCWDLHPEKRLVRGRPPSGRRSLFVSDSSQSNPSSGAKSKLSPDQLKELQAYISRLSTTPEDNEKGSHMEGVTVDAQPTVARDHLFGQVYVRKEKATVEDVVDEDRTNPNPVISPDDPSPSNEELPIALRKGTRSFDEEEAAIETNQCDGESRNKNREQKQTGRRNQVVGAGRRSRSPEQVAGADRRNRTESGGSSQGRTNRRAKVDRRAAKKKANTVMRGRYGDGRLSQKRRAAEIEASGLRLRHRSTKPEATETEAEAPPEQNRSARRKRLAALAEAEASGGGAGWRRRRWTRLKGGLAAGTVSHRTWRIRSTWTQSSPDAVEVTASSSVLSKTLPPPPPASSPRSAAAVPRSAAGSGCAAVRFCFSAPLLVFLPFCVSATVGGCWFCACLFVMAEEMGPKNDVVLDAGSTSKTENVPIQVTSIRLTKDNYLSWSAALEIGITSRGRLSYITGDKPAPSKSDPQWATWALEDSQVKVWIISSVSSDIQPLILRKPTSFDMWTVLAKMYGRKKRHLRTYQIKRSIYSLKQGDLSVAALKTKWEELDYHVNDE